MQQQPVVSTLDLTREQSEFVAFLEKAIDPDLLAVVQQAYQTSDEMIEESAIEISYEGTIHA